LFQFYHADFTFKRWENRNPFCSNFVIGQKKDKGHSGWYIISQQFEVLMVVNMIITAFFDVTPCSLVEKYLHFGGTYRLHLSDRRVILMMEAVVSPKQWFASFNLTT
jgi:hypothetical protein